MSDVPTFRLYLLRAMYLLMAVGLGITIWPGILAPGDNVSHMGSVVRSMLGTLALVALWGLRYPVKMLPMLLLEKQDELDSRTWWERRSAAIQ